MTEFQDMQAYYRAIEAKSKTAKEKRVGISDATKKYLRQQMLEVTKQTEAEQREAKRLAALEKKRQQKRGSNE